MKSILSEPLGGRRKKTGSQARERRSSTNWVSFSSSNVSLMASSLTGGDSHCSTGWKSTRMEADFPNARIPATTFESFADVLIFWQWRVYLKNSLLASIGAAEERNLEDVFEDMFLGARGDRTRRVIRTPLGSLRVVMGALARACGSTWPPTQRAGHVRTRGVARVNTWQSHVEAHGGDFKKFTDGT